MNGIWNLGEDKIRHWVIPKLYGKEATSKILIDVSLVPRRVTGTAQVFKEYFLGNWVENEELSPKELRYCTGRGNHSSPYPRPLRQRCRVPGKREDCSILEAKRESSFRKKSCKSHVPLQMLLRGQRNSMERDVKCPSYIQLCWSGWERN